MFNIIQSYFNFRKPLARLPFAVIILASYILGGVYLADIIPEEAVQKFQETGESPFAFFEPAFHQELILFFIGAITFPAYIKRFLDVGAKRPQTYTLIIFIPLILKTLLSTKGMTTLAAPIFMIDLIGIVITLALMITPGRVSS